MSSVANSSNASPRRRSPDTRSPPTEAHPDLRRAAPQSDLRTEPEYQPGSLLWPTCFCGIILFNKMPRRRFQVACPRLPVALRQHSSYLATPNMQLYLVSLGVLAVVISISASAKPVAHDSSGISSTVNSRDDPPPLPIGECVISSSLYSLVVANTDVFSTGATVSAIRVSTDSKCAMARRRPHPQRSHPVFMLPLPSPRESELFRHRYAVSGR